MIEYSELDKYLEDVYGVKACYSIKELGEVQCSEDMETVIPKKCPSINIDLGMKKDNFVIEVLDLEHGQRVKKYFESLGVDVSLYFFDANRKDNDTIRYYGVIDGFFNNYAEKNLPSHVQVIKLPAEEAEKTLEEKIKELALSENKVVKNLILEDVPNIKWCLVWDKGSLKPSIVYIDFAVGYDNIIPLPDNMNEFINKNFM